MNTMNNNMNTTSITVSGFNNRIHMDIREDKTIHIIVDGSPINTTGISLSLSKRAACSRKTAMIAHICARLEHTDEQRRHLAQTVPPKYKGWLVGKHVWSMFCIIKQNLDQQLLRWLFSANAATIDVYNEANHPFARQLLSEGKWLTFRAYMAHSLIVDKPGAMEVTKRQAHLGHFTNILRNVGLELWDVPIPELSLRMKHTHASDLTDLELYVGVAMNELEKLGSLGPIPRRTVSSLIKLGRSVMNGNVKPGQHRYANVAPDSLIRAQDYRKGILKEIQKLKHGMVTRRHDLYYLPEVIQIRPIRSVARILSSHDIQFLVDPLYVLLLGAKNLRRAIAQGDRQTLGEIIHQELKSKFGQETAEYLRGAFPRIRPEIEPWVLNKKDQLLKQREGQAQGRMVTYRYFSRLDEVTVQDLTNEYTGEVDYHANVERIFERVARRRIRETLERNQLEYSEVPQIPEMEVGGIKVTHLHTALSVVEEGELMRHCVGMYAAQAMKGRYLVFHLDDGTENGATAGYDVTITKDGDGFDVCVYLQQTHGLFNTAVSPETYKVATEIATLLTADRVWGSQWEAMVLERGQGRVTAEQVAELERAFGVGAEALDDLV